VREHNEAVNYLDYMTAREAIVADYAPGALEEVVQHDGSILRLRKLEPDYNPHDRLAAMTYLGERAAKGEIVTGLLYVDADPQDLHGFLGTVEAPLNELGEAELVPGSKALDKLNQALR